MQGPVGDSPLLYNIYEVPEFRDGDSVWGGNIRGFGDGPRLITVPLNSNGSAEQSQILYFEIWQPRRQIVRPTGRYSSNFVSLRDSRMEYGYDSGNNCNEPLDFGTTGDFNDFRVLSAGFTVTATVVEPTQAFGFSKAFEPDSVGQGGLSRLTFTIDGSATVFRRFELNFTDDFPGGMVVAPEPDASTTCGGTVSATAGGTTVEFSDGAIEEGETCTVAVNVRALRAGTLENTSSGLKARFIPGATPAAEATLTVDPAAAPGFAKAFSPARIAPGDVSTLTFTIDNTAKLIDVGGLAFDDDFPDGMVVAGTPNASTTCGGTLSAPAGGGMVSLSGGTVPANVECAVTVQVTSTATATNVSGDLTSDAGNSGSATDTLTVTPVAPLSFTKSFGKSPISAGDSQTMTFTIAGPGVGDFSEIAFTDNLSGFLGGVIPTVTNLPQSEFCGLGSLASTFVLSGELILSVNRAALTGDGSCELVVEFTVPADLPSGDYTNTTSGLSALHGIEARPINFLPASGTMTVLGPTADLAVTVTDATDPIVPGASQVYTVQVTNNGPRDAPAVVGTFTLPAGATFVSTSDCAEDPDGVPTCALGRIAASDSASYTVTATIDGSTTGTITASATAVSTAMGPAVVDHNSANDTGTEDTEVTPVADISVTNDDGLTSVDVGGTVTYRIVAANNGPSADPAVRLTDDFPDGLTMCSYTSVAAGGASDNTAAGTGDLSETLSLPVGGEVAYTATCTVDGSAGSTLSNTATVVGSLSDPDNGNDSATDDDTVINPVAPGFAKVFSPATVDPGGISRLTYTINNEANLIDVGGLAFDDGFPDGLVVADTPNGSTTCGGTLTAAAGGDTVSLSGGDVAPGGTCTLAVDVRALVAGRLTSTSGALTSDLPVAAPGASATLTVDEAPLLVSMSFSLSTIGQGGVSRLSYVLRNGALIPATSVALSDRLPADVVLAPELNADNGCGGFLSASAGGSEVSYSGGSLAAGAACTIAVDVTSAIAGSYSNDMVNVTSSLGTSAAAEATLTVNEVPLSVSMSFEPPMIGQGGVSRLSYVLRNGALIPATSVALSDRLPADVVLAPELNADNGCGGFLSASAGGSEVSYSGGSLAAGAACTIAVDVTSAIAGSYSNDMVNVTSSLGTSAAAEATLTVNEVPLSVSMSFEPPMIGQGGVSRLSYVLRNGALIPATSVALSDRLPADVVLAPELNADNGCGGFLSASAGGSEVSYSGGSLAAGAACTIAVDVTSAIAGSYSNDMVNVTSSLGTSAAAEATLTVNEVPLSVSMSFEPPMIGQGGVSRLSYVLRNGALIPATSVALSDRLPADVVLAPELNADNGCGGFLSASAGGSEVSYSGGSLAAGAACTIAVDVTSAIAGSYSNDMVNVTSSLGTSAAAEATLTVNEVPLSVSMSFEPPMIGQGGVSRLSYVLRNGALIPATSVALSDRLPADVVLAPELNADNGCGGFLSASAGGSEVSYSGGSLAAGAACTIAVDVTSAIAGSYSNDMVNVTSSLGTSAAAEATLTVNEVPLSVSMSFVPPMIDQGGVSRLSYVLRNGALIPATSVALSDRLPADVVLAPELNADNGCGGFLSASAGGSEVSYSGGSLAAGAACTIAVDVTSAIAGSYSNDMVNVTSSLGTSAAAEATLTVNEVPLSVSMSFVPPMIDQGGVSRLSYVLRNGALIPATSVALSDRLPADVVLAPELNADNGCGGFLSASAGGSEVSYSGGSLAAGAACTIAVDVTSAIAGSYSNDMVNVTSSLGTSAAAEATLTVNEVPLSVSMSFEPPMIGQGGVSRLSYVLRNGALIPATSVALSDRLPADVVLAPELNADNGCGGFLSASAGGSEVSYSGGSLAAGAACTIAVDVTSAIAGSYSNDMVNVTSSLGTSAAAEATLTVNEVPLSVSMSFEPPMIGQGGVSRLSYVLRNGALIPATSVALSDRLPADVVLAPELNADNGCGGFLSASAGGSEVSYSGGSLAAGAACTIAVDVTSAIAGSYSNDMVNVTSSLGTSAAAEATLTVNEVPLSVSMSFEPPMIGQGGVSRLSYVLRNGALIPATSVALSDRLPADVVLAPELNADNGCGGFLSASAGGSEVSYSGGSLAAGAACTIAVDVTSAIAGSYSNDMVNVTSSLGTSAAAEATLTVNEVPLSVSMSFVPPMIGQGGVSRLSYVLRNGALIPATSVALSDRLPADVVLAPELNADNGCGGFLSASAGGSEVSYSGGSLAAGAACTIAVDVTSAIAGSYSNDMVNVTSSLGTSAAAEATLTVNEVPLSVSMSFVPPMIGQGGVSRLSYVLRNGALIPATSVALSDRLPADVVLAPELNADNGCGGFLSASAGGSLSGVGGRRLHDRVDVSIAGSYSNDMVNVTSSLGTSAAAEATLTVNEVPLSVSMSFVPPMIDQGRGLQAELCAAQRGADPGDVGCPVRQAARRCRAGARVERGQRMRRLPVGVGGRQRSLLFRRVACGGRRLHDRRRRDLRDCGKLFQRHGERDLVAGHQRRRRSHADGERSPAVGLDVVRAADDRSGRGLQAELCAAQRGADPGDIGCPVRQAAR